MKPLWVIGTCLLPLQTQIQASFKNRRTLLSDPVTGTFELIHHNVSSFICSFGRTALYFKLQASSGGPALHPLPQPAYKTSRRRNRVVVSS
ncbi:hypothetical protein SCHPADRAFT_902918 [Schizopora paradoxa]|uniref:Uncharacterized protein n=1 Tax=Schizopora paradoxa TaxID=27342 RepID=A0A0H2RSE8_9AGAM|nr:hypothetical protein SCHPADRAFT_902918 [Schizopora paradoxa]